MTNVKNKPNLSRIRIGKLITDLREQRGLKQSDLAKSLKTSQKESSS